MCAETGGMRDDIISGLLEFGGPSLSELGLHPIFLDPCVLGYVTDLLTSHSLSSQKE